MTNTWKTDGDGNDGTKERQNERTEQGNEGAKLSIVRFGGEPQDVVDRDRDNREMKNLQA